MAIQILPRTPGFAEKFGTGLGKGLEALAEQKLKQYEIQAKLGPLMEMFNKTYGTGGQGQQAADQGQQIADQGQQEGVQQAQEKPAMTPEEKLQLASAYASGDPYRLGQASAEITKSRQKEKQLELRKEAAAENKMTGRFMAVGKEYNKVIDAGKKARDTIKTIQEMKKLDETGKLIGPRSAKLLETLGLPLGVLEKPESEAFQGLATEFMRGLSDVYGGRTTMPIIKEFLKSVPDLFKSPEGRQGFYKRILRLAKGSMVESKQAGEIFKESKGILPLDFTSQVDEKAQNFLKQEQASLPPVASYPKGTVLRDEITGAVSFISDGSEWVEQ